ncbi:MAG: hypothetical protein GWQ05_01520 [Verrucomicrobiaceae bacterium]|nr:hypothetical protein [Verrucomicrobiaceae bacterium]
MIGTGFTQALDHNEGIDVNWAIDGNLFDTVEADLSGASSIQNATTVYLRLDDLEEMTGNDRFAFAKLEHQFLSLELSYR